MTPTTSLIAPGPRKSIWRELNRVRHDPHGFVRDLAQTYGDIVFVPIGNYDAWLLSHPDAIRQVVLSPDFHKGRVTQRLGKFLGNGLLTSEDPFHKAQRRMIQPAFHRAQVANYGSIITSVCARLMADWQPGQIVSVTASMADVTAAIAAQALLGLDVSHADRQAARQDLAVVLQMYANYSGLPQFSLLLKLPLPTTRHFYSAQARLDALLERLVAERRARSSEGTDVLSLLLQAHEADERDEPMSGAQIRDEIMTIYFAGQETLMSLLTWIWYVLGEHPVIEERLVAEWSSVLGGRTPTADDVPQLPVTTQVVSETLRLYPPIIALSREVLTPHPVGDYVIPTGANIYMSQFVVHRDPRWWPDPLRFDPDRFAPGAERDRPKFAYFPFGGGPRHCIGESLAWLEAVLVLATIGQQWQFRRVSTEPVRFSKSILSLVPADGMPMQGRRR